MATNDNILSDDDLYLMLREGGAGSGEWTTPGATSDVAPLFGGTWQQHYPRPRGIKKLALMRTKAGLVSGPSEVTDNTNGDTPYGTTALRYNGSAAYVFRSTLGGTSGVMPAIDVTTGSIRLWFRAGPNFFNAGPQAFNLRLYSAGSPTSPSTDYTDFSTYFMRGQVTARTATDWGPWQCYTIPGYNATIASDSLKGITRGGSGATATAITYATVNAQGGGSGCQFEIGDIEFIPNPRTKGAVIFTFDDGRVDTFTNAAEIMSRYGFPGVVMSGAPASEIGQAGRLSVQQLRNLQDIHGWQIASQSWSTEDLTTVRALTEAQRTAFYGKLRAWHAAMGFRGGMDGSYYSGVSQTELDMLPSLRQHFRTLRTYGGPGSYGTAHHSLWGECAPQ